MFYGILAHVPPQKSSLSSLNTICGLHVCLKCGSIHGPCKLLVVFVGTTGSKSRTIREIERVESVLIGF